MPRRAVVQDVRDDASSYTDLSEIYYPQMSAAVTTTTSTNAGRGRKRRAVPEYVDDNDSVGARSIHTFVNTPVDGDVMRRDILKDDRECWGCMYQFGPQGVPGTEPEVEKLFNLLYLPNVPYVNPPSDELLK